MKVLIAVDDSPYSECVVDSAVKREWPSKTEMLVVSVLEPIPFDCESDSQMRSLIEEGTSKRRQSAQALVEKVSNTLKEQLSSKNIEIAFCVKHGSAKKEIVDSAIEFGADRILIGAQGHGTCAHNMLGEVSRVVAATAPCSVEIIRETAKAL
ncbi:MAG TPA: universal stress protein [Candidatus Melainabacteria bacterium]|nr:universal stress protein [Candidatus Melainabacteria bacterium]